MAELREVKLERIHPNPFRDIENYPFWRDKLDRLKESIRSTGQWPNIIVRQRKDGEYELAYGHHRIQALRELAEEGVVKPVVTVILQPLEDDVMLRMMADENAEEFGTNFMLGTMNAVSAVLKAFVAGKVELEKPERARYFAGPQDTFPYTVETVANYLCWLMENGNPHPKVFTAVNALELIRLGVCKPNAFQGLSHDQARAVVQQAQLVYKARLRELDKKAEEKEKKAAEKEAQKLAAAAVAKSVGAIKEGQGTTFIREQTEKIRAEVQPVATQRVKPASELDISRMMDKAAEGLEAWLTNHGGTLALWARGAICDKASERRFYSKFNAVEKAVKVAEDRRED